MKTPLLTLLGFLCLSQCSLHAQSIKNATQTTWKLRTIGSNTPFNHSTDNQTKQSILYVSSTEAIVPFNEPKGAQQIVFSLKGDMGGVAKVTDKGQVKWKTPLHNGQLLGVAMLQGDVLVLSIPEWTSPSNSWTVVSAIKATLINAATGKKLMEKDIALNATNFTEFIVHKSEAGEFQSLLVRHTKWNGKKGMSINKYEKEARQTESLQLFSIGKDLTAKPSGTIPVNNSELQFLASQIDAQGTLSIASATSSSLMLEQYASGQTTAAVKILSPFEWNEKVQPNVILKANPSLPSQLALGVQYNHRNTNIIKTVLFDVSAKKGAAFEEPLTNDYRKTLEETVIVAQGRSKEIFKKVFADLKLSDILFYGNQAIVVKEARGSYSVTPQSASRYFTGDVIISILKPNATITKQYLLSKYVERFIGNGLSLGTIIQGDQFQFVTVEDGKGLSFSTLYGSINLKDMQWEKLELVKEGNAVAKGHIEPASTIWFAGSAVLNMLEQKAFGGAAIVAELKVMDK